jgi:hypothetical protein
VTHNGLYARSIIMREDFHDWLYQAEPLVSFKLPDPDAPDVVGLVRAGAPDDEDGASFGATIYATDGIAEWAEWYQDPAHAVARVAALMQAATVDEHFKDQAEGFVRWAENFFTHTVHAPRAQDGGTP